MKLNAFKRDIITCQIYMFLITRSRAYPQGYTVLYGVTLWVSGVTTASADPATQGAREGRKLVPTPPHKKYLGHSCRLCIVVLMDAAQFRLLRIVRSLGRGDPMTMFAAFAGGPEFLVTPLLWVCLS